MKEVGYFFGILITLILVGVLLSYPLMLLWNICLVPAVPSIKSVTWLQMWGISMLFSCLFGTSNYKKG
jgi:hypothetical protein